ncbi:hypothetical protein Q8F55_004734 [Vanrija albida]|uniref:DUF202 domain-containing protein n=1 Tax=Vanrija albida TaxID=181172 RepID=A0ABR3PZZ7_9TREE
MAADAPYEGTPLKLQPAGSSLTEPLLLEEGRFAASEDGIDEGDEEGERSPALRFAICLLIVGAFTTHYSMRELDSLRELDSPDWGVGGVGVGIGLALVMLGLWAPVKR